MPLTEYHQILATLGLGSHQAVADLMGVSERTARRFAADGTAIPKAAAMLLRLAVRYRLKPAVLIEEFGD